MRTVSKGEVLKLIVTWNTGLETPVWLHSNYVDRECNSSMHQNGIKESQMYMYNIYISNIE
jgi:hypothetical protein